MEAIFAYNPALPDELKLAPGDMIEVANLYDDNWASGTLRRGDGTTQLGAFPLVCVSAQIGSDSCVPSPFSFVNYHWVADALVMMYSGTFSGSRSAPGGGRTHPSVAPSDRSSSRGDEFRTATAGARSEGSKPDDSAHLFSSRVVFPSRRP